MATAAVKSYVGSSIGIRSNDCGEGQQDRHVFVVCTGEECAQAGSHELLHELRHECRHARGDVRVGASRCLGHCQLAPAMMEDGRMMGWVSPRRLRSELHRLGIKD